MKKFALPFVALAFSCTAMNVSVHAQQTSTDSLTAIAHQLGIQSVDIPGFIRLHSGENHSSENHFRAPENMAPVSISNGGFESGNFTGWNGYIGDNDLSSLGPLQNLTTGIFSTTMNAPITDVNARHTIMDTASGGDWEGGFQIVPPGYGMYVVRLGNNLGLYQGEILEQTWTVDPSEANFYVNFATVINDGGHTLGEGGYFKYEILDTLGDTVAYRMDQCAALPPGYQVSANNILYLPWQHDTIDLSAYIGQDLTIRFTAAGCVFSGHYAYAYVDAGAYSTVGIYENEKSFFSLYPNPSNGVFNLKFSESNSNGTITVRDLPGKTILTNSFSNSGNVQLDLSSQPAGIYFVTVQNASGVSTQRIVVE